MRLLNVHTKQLHTFYGSSTPKYAILSHTWLADYEEVTFPRLQSQQPSTWSHLPGAKKVDYTCQQAASDGFEWAWIDTCCIDKTNNAELSEAINSMFRWYQNAQVCYVFLLDVDPETGGDMFTSRWWSRAWTLQELVAPANVQFFDGDWRNVGSKSDLADEIALKKSIDSDTLRDSAMIFSQSVAQRMCWAAQRQATREEDLAYALLGIFDINMTMQYGEGGEKAFVRLQKEIMRMTKDMSIFAWGFKALPLEDLFSGSIEFDFWKRLDLSGLDMVEDPGNMSRYGLLASGPSDFAGTHDIVCLSEHVKDVADVEVEEERYGVQTLKTLVIDLFEVYRGAFDRGLLALLPCIPRDNPQYLLGIYFQYSGRRGRYVTRHAFDGKSFTCLISNKCAVTASLKSLKIDTRGLMRGYDTSIKPDTFSRTLIIDSQRGVFRGDIYCEMPNLSFDEILKPTWWEHDQSDPNRFIIRSGPPEVSTLMRFRNERAPYAVYLHFVDNLATRVDPKQDRSYNVRCNMVALPPDLPQDQVTATLKDLDRNRSTWGQYGVMNEISAVAPNRMMSKMFIEPRCKGTTKYDFAKCKYITLYVKVTTTVFFNQALTMVDLELTEAEEGGRTLLETPEMKDYYAMLLDLEDWVTPLDLSSDDGASDVKKPSINNSAGMGRRLGG